MKNIEWLLKNNVDLDSIRMRINSAGDYEIHNSETGMEYAIIDPAKGAGRYRVLLEWMNKEHKEKPLTYQEFIYLYGVISPLKDQVNKVRISVQAMSISGEFLLITYQDPDRGRGIMSFPVFKNGIRYKGMERGREYSLEELEID